MSFWRRWLKQWGYVRIRDYGLIVTDAGQVIRVSDGVVVNAPAPPLPPAPSAYPMSQRPPTPTPQPSPLGPPATAEPAPAFLPPPSPPPPPRAPAPPRKRTASGTSPPPLPLPRVARLPVETIDREETDVRPPRIEKRRPQPKPLPSLMGRPRIPPRPATETTTSSDLVPRRADTEPGAADLFDAPYGDPTIVDQAPRSEMLPRLSARLAARRKIR